ncbi:MAG: carboxymethylenebutenolidase [Betaproteobacteria bacterium HGW-Betaproteobacteria-22]|nr:MAG: carboxymethylenebutenolidase [Betaproteobacteria bacterium HGW-Betaproteobacteria-22]
MASTTEKPHFNRREFLAAAIATGFALAVQPVSATVVSTNKSSIIDRAVGIPTASDTLPAYVAYPDGNGPWPVILVVQEIFGVHEHIKDICRRFAKLGYLAIAPELYFRQGDVSKIKDINEILATVVSKVPDAQVLADLDAAVAWSEASGLGAKGKLGITGFCWGGRITWLYAAHNPNVKAGVAWYGRLEGNKTALQPLHPIDVVAELKAPVLGLYGEADQGIPLESVERVRAKLSTSHHASEIVVYPEAPHAFFADYRPSYRKLAADDGWLKLQYWFTKNGLSPNKL